MSQLLASGMFEVTNCDLKQKILQILRLQIATSNRPYILRSQIATSKQALYFSSPMPKRPAQLAIPVESRILILRHQRVILDNDLAELYGV